jgi:hypothetical protein
MATRLYVTKYTDTGDDLVEAKQDFEALDYVDAMREGSAYGSEIYNLRDDLLPLKDYVQRYDALGDSGKVLYLNHSPGAGDAPAGSYVPKRFALLLFGSYEQSRQDHPSKMLADLRTDPTWSLLQEIRASDGINSEDMFASFVEKKFGTNHRKLLVMIGSIQFGGQIKNSFPLRDIWSKPGARRSVDVPKLMQFINLMAYPSVVRQEKEPDKEPQEKKLPVQKTFAATAAPTTSRGAGMQMRTMENGSLTSVDRIIGPMRRGHRPGEVVVSNGRKFRWNGTVWYRC